MILIFIIHAFQATGSAESPLVSGIFIFATMTGAAIFIFVLGFGTVYSRHSQPREMVKSGVRLVIYQYLSNLLYVASLALPFLFVSGSLNDEGMESFRTYIWIYLQFINIFFISGIIYLVLALCRKLNFNAAAYLGFGAAAAVAAPFLSAKQVDVPVLGYVVGLLVGDPEYVSFTPLYFLSYALIGAAYGKMFRRVRDKSRFYKLTMPVCGVIVILWWVSVYFRCSAEFTVTDIWSFEEIMGFAYPHPDIRHIAASLAHIILLAGMFHFAELLRVKKSGDSGRRGILSSQMLWYSKHISKYYALHIVPYFIAFGFNGYMGFDVIFCWLLALISMVITEVFVRAYVHFEEAIKTKLTPKKKQHS